MVRDRRRLLLARVDLVLSDRSRVGSSALADLPPRKDLAAPVPDLSVAARGEALAAVAPDRGDRRSRLGRAPRLLDRRARLVVRNDRARARAARPQAVRHGVRRADRAL